MLTRVTPCAASSAAFSSVEAVGRGLDGEFVAAAARGSHRLIDSQQPPRVGSRIQVGRRAAADEQRLDRPRLAERREFRRERVEVVLDEVVLARR